MQKIHPAGVPNFGKPLHIGSLLLSPSSPTPINNTNNNNTNFMYKPNTVATNFGGFEHQWMNSPKSYYSIPSPSSSPSSSPLVPNQEDDSPSKKQKLQHNNDKHILNNPYNDILINNKQKVSEDGSSSSIRNILNPVDNSSFQFESHLPRSSSSSPSSSSMLIKDGSSRSILQSNAISENCSPVSSPLSPIDHMSSPSNASNKQLVSQWIQELANLKKRETFLLENLKYFTNSDVESDDQMEINQSPPTISVPQVEVKSTNNNGQILNISQQPPEFVVCHRYIHPSPVLSVDPELLTKYNGQLVVQVSLVYNSTFKPVTTKQADGKLEVLQGVRTQEVDKNGFVVFNKLKVSEVSSKHLHQSFCFLYTLSEVRQPNEEPTFMTQTTSSSFHVLSRSNKRKKDDETDSDSQEPSSPINSKSSPVCSSPSSPSSPYHNNNVASVSTPTFVATVAAEENVTATVVMPSAPVVSHHSPSSSSSSSSSSSDPNYIDITELLVLPQKEAASRLGISESMLCKRFKECTRRKWPYRYLRKIDKVIKILKFQHGNDIPKEEKEKLEKLMQEREECLRPVKIRITGCLEKDDDQSPTSGSTYNFKVVTSTGAPIATHRSSGSSSQLVPQTPTKSNTIQSIINFNETEETQQRGGLVQGSNKVVFPSQFSQGGNENQGLENILETLEMLKHTRQ